MRDAIDRVYQEGFSSQAKMEMIEEATEMERQKIERQMHKESQLITGAQFMADADTFRRIEFGHRPSVQPNATLRFNTTVQPLFHKNFDLLKQAFEDYRLKGYQIYILADSQKQNERLREILNSLGTVSNESSSGNSLRTVPSEFRRACRRLAARRNSSRPKGLSR